MTREQEEFLKYKDSVAVRYTPFLEASSDIMKDPDIIKIENNIDRRGKKKTTPRNEIR